MNNDVTELSVRANSAIERLSKVRKSLGDELNTIGVAVDRESDTTIDRALSHIFPDEKDAKDGKITFKMYTDCLRILKMAGEIKGRQHTEKKYGA